MIIALYSEHGNDSETKGNFTPWAFLYSMHPVPLAVFSHT